MLPGPVDGIEGAFSNGKAGIYAKKEANGINLKREKFLDGLGYPNMLHFLVFDSSAKRSVNAFMELVPGRSDEMIWTVDETESITFGKKKREPISLPRKLVLKRVQ